MLITTVPVYVGLRFSLSPGEKEMCDLNVEKKYVERTSME